MLASKEIGPPGQFNPEGIGEPVIGVRIVVLRDAGTPFVYPEHNRVGTGILCSLLQARMELAGVRVIDVCRAFPLNRACYMFTVSNLTLAQESIKEALEELGLLESAQIAWRDPREEIWRVWYSKSGRFESPSAEELAVAGEFLRTVISALKKCPRSEYERDGQ